jgi:hypothetical protein
MHVPDYGGARRENQSDLSGVFVVGFDYDYDQRLRLSGGGRWSVIGGRIGCDLAHGMRLRPVDRSAAMAYNESVLRTDPISLPGGVVSQAPPPAAAPARKKKKRGCCSCCLWLVLLVVLLGVSFAAAAHFIMRDPPNPVKEEYESIPDYFSRLVPPDNPTTLDTRLRPNHLSHPQSAIRNPQSAIVQSAIDPSALAGGHHA